MKIEKLCDKTANQAAYDAYLAELGTDNSAFRKQFREAFMQALHEQLTARQYQVLWLSEVEGLSGKEISYRLGISQSAVSRHLTRGKNRLRVLLAVCRWAERIQKNRSGWDKPAGAVFLQMDGKCVCKVRAAIDRLD